MWQDLNSSILSTVTSIDDESSKGTALSTGKPPLSFEEVSLGVLIRSTPSGRLFRGLWNKEPVTVKVCTQPCQGKLVCRMHGREVMDTCAGCHQAMSRCNSRSTYAAHQIPPVSRHACMIAL